jgi:hypothetical protein
VVFSYQHVRGLVWCTQDKGGSLLSLDRQCSRRLVSVSGNHFLIGAVLIGLLEAIIFIRNGSADLSVSPVRSYDSWFLSHVY